MKKLFIHHFLFRLLSPVFSGIIIYLLILLLNNEVDQLQEEFFGNELYFCIGLSYIIQELSRFLLLFFQRLKLTSTFTKLLIQVLISMTLCVVLVTISVKVYFDNVLGFDATFEEVITFNSIFCTITFIYISLFLSHEYVYKMNTKKMSYEELIKQNIEEDFWQFKKGINPNLLFESLEALLNLIDENPSKTDDFINHLATIYRHILSAKDKQLVLFSEEIDVFLELIKLFNYLPYRKLSLKNTIENTFFILPGTLLFLTEKIIKKTIVSSTANLELTFTEKDTYFEIKYIKNDKISEEFSVEDILEIKDAFSIYSEKKIRMQERDEVRIITIPKLKIQS